MKKIFLLLGVFLIFSQFIGAQQNEILNHPLNTGNIDTFRAVCARIARHPFIKGTFEQEKIISRLNRSMNSSGSFIITSNLGMVWETINPFPSTLVLGRDFMIQSRPGSQRTVLSAQGNETFQGMAQVIGGVFSGNAASLENNFEIFFTGNISSWEMALIPRDKTISSFAQRISMRGSDVIRVIYISEQNGDSIIYTLLNHTFPASLTAGETALFSLP